jgi:hypothetical protein
MVPESTRTLLPNLEAIKRVMVDKKGANLKEKGKGGTAPSEPKGNPKCKASGGPTGQVPKKGCIEKFLPVMQGPWWTLHDAQHHRLPLL